MIWGGRLFWEIKGNISVENVLFLYFKGVDQKESNATKKLPWNGKKKKGVLEEKMKLSQQNIGKKWKRGKNKNTEGSKTRQKEKQTLSIKTMIRNLRGKKPWKKEKNITEVMKEFMVSKGKEDSPCV